MKTFGFTALINGVLNKLRGNLAYSQCIKSEKAVCYGHFIDKFVGDKIFRESGDYVLLLDGVVLNKRQLMNAAKETDWFSYLIVLYEEKGDVFFDELRGSFGGLLVDKRKNKSILFTDHIGSKFMYYTLHGDSFACSTMITNLYKIRHDNGLKCTLSEQGAIMMLTYGFMLENYTLCEEVKKVQPGCYVTFEDGRVTEHRYCMLDNTPDYSITERDAIELYDEEFRRAVALEFDKDREYGYRHLVALSAGLDCRMTSWVAHEMGYTDQLNVTFSQTDYWDEIVPKQMAAEMKHEWMFKALDNGLWLYNLDNVLEITGGNVLYYGQAHGFSMYKYLNFEEFGIAHSGQLGDVIFGSCSRNNQILYHLGDGSYSKKYISYLGTVNLSKYVNQEIGTFYNRYFNGTNNGQLGEMPFTETCAPHMNWDTMNAIMKVPVAMRYNHNTYKKWIIAKYPKAAGFVWESIGSKITGPTLTIMGRTRTLKHWSRTVINLLPFKKSGINNKKHMNPIGYYLQTNTELRSFIDEKLSEVDYVKNETIRNILLEIIAKGTSMEKIQAVTLIRTVKLFGLE